MTYGDDFQKKSKYSRSALSGKHLDWGNKPEPYKVYPADKERVELEPPDVKGGGPLFSLLKKRRSIRNYPGEPLGKKALAQLLWASQGVSRQTGGHLLRTAPSAGALYPIETYVAVNNVATLKPGVYHYEVPFHRLALIREGEWGQPLARAALGQQMLMRAPVVFAWSALVERSRWKYGQRAYRYIYLDAGHIAQNLALAAVDWGLGSCQIGAFFDDEVDQVFALDGVEETVIYMTAVGAVR